jgi:hypothetical protein
MQSTTKQVALSEHFGTVTIMTMKLISMTKCMFKTPICTNTQPCQNQAQAKQKNKQEASPQDTAANIFPNLATYTQCSWT